MKEHARYFRAVAYGTSRKSKTVTRQLIRAITGKMLFRCEAILVRGKQCFSMASGSCDNCQKCLCSEHKATRTEKGHARTVIYIFCANCAAQFDKDAFLL